MCLILALEVGRGKCMDGCAGVDVYRLSAWMFMDYDFYFLCVDLMDGMAAMFASAGMDGWFLKVVFLCCNVCLCVEMDGMDGCLMKWLTMLNF